MRLRQRERDQDAADSTIRRTKVVRLRTRDAFRGFAATA